MKNHLRVNDIWIAIGILNFEWRFLGLSKFVELETKPRTKLCKKFTILLKILKIHEIHDKPLKNLQISRKIISS